eukprot:6177838-Pleurochrysis_carterae.AAC.3
MGDFNYNQLLGVELQLRTGTFTFEVPHEQNFWSHRSEEAQRKLPSGSDRQIAISAVWALIVMATMNCCSDESSKNQQHVQTQRIHALLRKLLRLIKHAASMCMQNEWPRLRLIFMAIH